MPLRPPDERLSDPVPTVAAMTDSPNTTGTPGTTGNDTPATETAEKPVEQWATGDEPATGPQLSYLSTLAREAGEDVPDGITKAEASQLIDKLQQKSGRGA